MARRIVAASILIAVSMSVAPLLTVVKAPDPLSGFSRLAELLPERFCPDRKFSGESLYVPAATLRVIVSEVRLPIFEPRLTPPFEPVEDLCSRFWRAPPFRN